MSISGLLKLHEACLCYDTRAVISDAEAAPWDPVTVRREFLVGFGL